MSKNNVSQSGSQSQPSKMSRLWNRFKILVGASEAEKQAIGSPSQSEKGRAFAFSGVMSPLLQKVSQTEDGFEVVIDAADHSADVLGSIIAQGLGIKADKGTMTVADAPITELLQTHVLTVSVLDHKEGRSAAEQATALAGDNDVQGILSTIHNLFGRGDVPIVGKPTGYSIVDLLDAPGVSTLNMLDTMLPHLRVTEDGAFILLFAESLLRRTDPATVWRYLSNKYTEASYGE